MKFRIEWQRMKADPLHLLWVPIYVLAGVLLLPLFDSAFVRLGLKVRISYFINFLSIPVIAGGLRIEEGIKRFGGETLVHSWSDHTTIVLYAILSSIILLPFFEWALKERARWRENPKPGFPFKIVVSVGLTGSLLFGTVWLSAFGPIRSASAYRSLHRGQTVSANKDALINDLNFLALKAQSFYFVPTKEGGGGGRWLNIQGKSNQALTLQDIEHHEPIIGRVIGDAFPQKPSRFVLQVFGEDSLAIWGIGSELGDDTTFVNKNGERGKLELQMLVTPKKISTNERNTNDRN
jgi:hypothetical protein